MPVEYLAKYGQAVIDQGYDICFIREGEKRPFGKNWEATKHGPKRLAGAIENGRGGMGVGVKTAKTPLVDIDCYSEEIVEHMRDFVIDLLGDTLARTGLPPKLGLVYRSEDPFPKTQSKVFLDDEGRQVKLEVLGDGQQFVALAIHPDTGKPYRWKDKRHVGNVPRDELPEISQDDALAIVEEFERMARKAGWPEKASGRRLTERKSGGDYDYDDPFITDKAKVEITKEELRAKLQMVPSPDDYDQWFQVGMALYHQFDGSTEGLDLWQEWSAVAHNYDSDALDDKWPTFAVEGKKREPLTARYILKQAKEEESRIATDELVEIKEALEEAEDMPAIKLVCERIKRIAFDSIMRTSLVQEIREALIAKTGVKMSPSAVQALVRYENPENHATPPWLTHFVYCQQDETFYSTKTRQTLTTKAFDQSFGRFMMTKKDRLEGRSSPEHTASHVALNRYQIPFVANRMYLPGEDEIFSVNGLEYVNAYSTDSVPDMPEKFSKREKRAIALVLRHLEHLFDDERDRKLLLSWLAYIVQTNKRVNWAPIIQGVQSDGKTFFHLLMGCALGGANVKTISGDSLGEGYTSWAEGVQFLFIEEVRLHGKDRFAVINKVKPYITNIMVSIRRMRTDLYDVLNTVNYMMTTNSKDGVPVDANDTRYFPLFSRWQAIERLKAFNAENPEYYTELHSVLEHAGALRKWLMEYDLHPEFDPDRRAPVSSSRAEMVRLNESDEDEALRLVLAESKDPALTKELLDTALLADAMTEHGGSLPYGRAMKTFLSEAGFTFLDRVKIKKEVRRFWTQNPKRFQVEGTGAANSQAIRDYLDEENDPI